MLHALSDASMGTSGASHEADDSSREGARPQFAKELVDELEEICAEAHVAATGKVLPAESRPSALAAAEGSGQDHGSGGRADNGNGNGDASADHDNEGSGNGAASSGAMALEGHGRGAVGYPDLTRGVRILSLN